MHERGMGGAFMPPSICEVQQSAQDGRASITAHLQGEPSLPALAGQFHGRDKQSVFRRSGLPVQEHVQQKWKPVLRTQSSLRRLRRLICAAVKLAQTA